MHRLPVDIATSVQPRAVSSSRSRISSPWVVPKLSSSLFGFWPAGPRITQATTLA
jgi:hypothetical protein